MKSFKTSILFIFSVILLYNSCQEEKPDIHIEEIVYKQIPHYKIITPTALYYYDKQSGGFSGIIDKEGNDWIAYNKSDSVTVPKSADSDFRGMPNLVYGGKQNGIGHPGFDKCTSKILSDSSVYTISKDSVYEYTWTFHEDKAVMHILKADTSRNYWFLYEGPIGGKYNPQSHFIFANTGKLIGKPEIMKGEFFEGEWSWVCFGDKNAANMMYVYHPNADKITDIVTYMGNSHEGINAIDGMVVFGFGRNTKTQPLMSAAPNYFETGFIPLNKNIQDTMRYLNQRIHFYSKK